MESTQDLILSFLGKNLCVKPPEMRLKVLHFVAKSHLMTDSLKMLIAVGSRQDERKGTYRETSLGKV